MAMPSLHGSQPSRVADRQREKSRLWLFQRELRTSNQNLANVRRLWKAQKRLTKILTKKAKVKAMRNKKIPLKRINAIAGRAIPRERKSSSYSVQKITFDWTSDDSGNASGTTLGTYNGEIVALSIILLETPVKGVFRIEIVDDEGFEILAMTGDKIADTSFGAVCESTLTLNISKAMGTRAKTGLLAVWIR